MNFHATFIQISLGDARSYYVTTARNDLGVIFATSEAGEPLVSTNVYGELSLSQAQQWNLFHGKK